MGCDIHGWVEVNFFGQPDKDKLEHPAWYDIRMLVGRNYAMFAKLFDIRNDLIKQLTEQEIINQKLLEKTS